MRTNPGAALTLTISLVVPSFSRAQSQEALAREHFEAARRAAGTEWATAADFFAKTADEIRPLLPSTRVDPAEPMKVFDNLYLVGHKQVVVWTITTTDGIVLPAISNRDVRVDEGPARKARRIAGAIDVLAPGTRNRWFQVPGSEACLSWRPCRQQP